jgi:pSer/pThr/pTyr-binding forkhead associated (FHA) protein
MALSPLAPHSSSPTELKDRVLAERRGHPFLLYRDGGDNQRIVDLNEAPDELIIGRRPSNQIPLSWDLSVSRVHAQLTRVGDYWTVSDDGLSRNGSFVNGRRLRGRRRLRDGDAIKVGCTLVVYLCGDGTAQATTTAATRQLEPPTLSGAQRRVLVSLCGPLDEAPFAGPRSNKEIADDLFLSVETVKTHLRALFDLFGIGELPQNRKRAELVRRAYETGVLG